MLTSATRGETLTPNPNECNSTLMSVTGVFLYPNIKFSGVPPLCKISLGRRQANLCFHFEGSGENLSDIAKSRDASMGRKQNSFLFQATSCHFSVEVYCTKAST